MILLDKFGDINLSITISHDKIKLNSVQITSDIQNQSLRFKWWIHSKEGIDWTKKWRKFWHRYR